MLNCQTNTNKLSGSIKLYLVIYNSIFLTMYLSLLITVKEHIEWGWITCCFRWYHHHCTRWLESIFIHLKLKDDITYPFSATILVFRSNCRSFLPQGSRMDIWLSVLVQADLVVFQARLFTSSSCTKSWWSTVVLHISWHGCFFIYNTELAARASSVTHQHNCQNSSGFSLALVVHASCPYSWMLA